MSGEGIVCHGTICHNIKLQADEVKLQVTDVDPPESMHPVYKVPVEKGSYTAIPCEKLLYNKDTS